MVRIPDPRRAAKSSGDVDGQPAPGRAGLCRRRHRGRRRPAGDLAALGAGVQQPGLVRRPAAPVLAHLRVQGQSAPGEERIDDVGLVRRGLPGPAAARPQPDDARGSRQRVEPVHVPDEGAQPALPDAVQHGVPGHHGAGGRRGVLLAGRNTGAGPDEPDGDGQAAGRRGVRLLRVQHGAGGDRHRVVDRTAGRRRVERELPLERAELLRRRAGRRRRLPDHQPFGFGLLAGPARGRAPLPDVPQLQGLPGPHRGRAAARAARSPTCTWRPSRRWRSPSTPRIRPPRRTSGACRCTRRASRARLAMSDNDIQRRQDGRAAARHRQARRARAHPVEARPAHAGGIPEDPDPPAGGRRDHRRGAVSVPGRAAHPEPPRAVGRQGVPGGAEGRGRSRSARASSPSSTTSTR